MFLAIGLFVSSLVRSQLVAAMLALVLSLPFVVAAFWRPELGTNAAAERILYVLSVPEHFRRDFTRGLIDTRPLILYGSITLLCLSLTVRSLEARRLRA
jgi:ABC-type transport system involved in multi-copper enzyme maturation permease subunit